MKEIHGLFMNIRYYSFARTEIIGITNSVVWKIYFRYFLTLYYMSVHMPYEKNRISLTICHNIVVAHKPTRLGTCLYLLIMDWLSFLNSINQQELSCIDFFMDQNMFRIHFHSFGVTRSDEDIFNNNITMDLVWLLFVELYQHYHSYLAHYRCS